MNTFTHDGKISWFDSHVYIENLSGTTFIYKQYKEHITREILDIYHTIHGTISQKPFEIIISHSIHFNSQTIKKIHFSVLDLASTPIHESCEYTPWEKPINSIKLTTHPTYIPWEVIAEVFYKFYSPDISDTILDHHIAKLFYKAITERHPELCQTSDTLWSFIDLNNIKIVNISENIMQCIITDLWKKIPPLVSLYQKNNQ